MTDISQGVVTCPNGHAQPGGGGKCNVCGIDIKAEEAGKPSVKPSAKLKHLFIAVGEAGRKILLDYYESFKTPKSEDNFLFLDTSTSDVEALARNSPTGKPAGEDFVDSFRKVGKSIKGAGRNWKRAENIVGEDRFLVDHLTNAGATQTESVVLITSMGGGTGAGVGPLVFDTLTDHGARGDRIAFGSLPSREEPEQLHFNAYCAFSRLVRFKHRRNADLIMVVDNTNVYSHKYVDNYGHELSSNKTLAHVLEMVCNRSGAQGEKRIEFSDLVQASRSTGIIHCTPCLALNHSLRIYEDLEGILESATVRPMANLDISSALFSFLILRVPNTLKSKFSADEMLKEYYRWKERNITNEVLGNTEIRYKEEASDRIDALLLLGGCDLNKLLSRAKEGYKVVRRSVLAGTNPEESYLAAGHWVSPGELNQLEDNLVDYTTQIDTIRAGVEGDPVRTRERDER